MVLVPEIGTSFKAAYGTSFRAPSLFELYGVDSFGTVGNPALKPESAQGWEVGWTTTVPVLGHADAVTFGATYFNEQVNDLIVGVFTPIATSVNVGSAHIQGVETEVTLRPAAWLTLHASYTFTDAISDDQPASEGSELLRRPRNAASADVTRDADAATAHRFDRDLYRAITRFPVRQSGQCDRLWCWAAWICCRI